MNEDIIKAIMATLERGFRVELLIGKDRELKIRTVGAKT